MNNLFKIDSIKLNGVEFPIDYLKPPIVYEPILFTPIDTDEPEIKIPSDCNIKMKITMDASGSKLKIYTKSTTRIIPNNTRRFSKRT